MPKDVWGQSKNSFEKRVFTLTPNIRSILFPHLTLYLYPLWEGATPGHCARHGQFSPIADRDDKSYETVISVNRSIFFF